MNKEMTGGFFRHIITVIAGALITTGGDSLDSIIPMLMANIAAGDANAIGGSAVAIFAVLWSMWVKVSEQTKQNVVQKFSIRKEK